MQKKCKLIRRGGGGESEEGGNKLKESKTKPWNPKAELWSCPIVAAPVLGILFLRHPAPLNYRDRICFFLMILRSLNIIKFEFDFNQF